MDFKQSDQEDKSYRKRWLRSYSQTCPCFWNWLLSNTFYKVAKCPVYKRFSAYHLLRWKTNPRL